MLSGVVEVDETSFGGNSHKRGKPSGGDRKMPVVAMLEGGGNVRTFPMERVTTDNIKKLVKKHVDQTAKLVTDESSVYHSISGEFPEHHPVDHSKICLGRDTKSSERRKRRSRRKPRPRKKLR